MFGTIAKIGGSILGSKLLGGDDSGGGGSTRTQYQYTPFEGDTDIEAPDFYDDLVSNLETQLSGENLGMSQEEMDAYTGQMTDVMNEQRDEGVQNVLNRFNSRGILGSTATGNALSDVEENYSDSFANAQTNMFLQNENMKRNQYNQAMGQGMNLARYDTGLQQQNFQNQFDQWQAEEGMKQAQAGIGQQNRAYADQRRSNKWASAGTGLMMGNKLFEGTDIGSGWGSALTGLAGYMFG